MVSRGNTLFSEWSLNSQTVSLIWEVFGRAEIWHGCQYTLQDVLVWASCAAANVFYIKVSLYQEKGVFPLYIHSSTI